VTLSLSLLGPPLAEVDGEPLTVDTRKATALLAYLTLEPGRHGRDSLAGLLWPEYAPDRARAALRRTLSTLRSGLGGRWLAVTRDAVSLDRDGVTVDVDEFRRLAATDDLVRLEQAAALQRDVFLAGFGLRDSVPFDDWQSFQAGTLARELGAVLDRLADGFAARGDTARAIEHARRRLALDPLNESAHRRLIELYGASGERAAALAQYRECVRTLHRELGVAPTEETTATYHAVREGVPRRPPLAEPAPTLAIGQRPLPLVGRERQWTALLDAYAAAGENGRLVVLDGETGIGKTRLAGELATWARAEGATAASVRCVEEESALAYNTAIELLRAALREGDTAALTQETAAEAARLVPELGTPPTPSLDGLGAQARFLDGVSRTLLEAMTGPRPGVLLVDDVHWADSSSLDVLAYLAHRLGGRPVLLVLTWRPEETPASHPVRRILAEAVRDGLGGSILLDRLGREEVAELAATAGAAPELAGRLYEETGGLPLFVVEYLDVRPDADGEQLPPGVRGLLESRIGAASEVAEQVLAAAAVLGRPFDADLVREVSGRSDDETVTALEELTRRGLVGEADGATYAFRHEQARRVAYELASAGRRRLLHRRAAAALETRDRGGAAAGAIAQHLVLAGRDAEAAEWLHAAGVHARSLYANAEALAHFRDALALGHGDPGALHEEIGDLLTLAGDYAGALDGYEAAAALAPPERLASIAHRIGLVHHRRGEWELAESSLAEALAALPAGETGLEARIVADRSLTAHRDRRDADAQELAAQALELAGAADDRRALAQAHNILGILASGRGEHAKAREQLERSLALATEEEDPSARAAALNNLALALRGEGELDRALELTAEALALAAAVGDRHREAALTNNSADLLHAAGRQEEAMGRLKEAVSIFAEIGEGATEPEIWKLVEW
jgi:DNA-binding SARP family transcriptional activator